jgi:hypothetical protein
MFVGALPTMPAPSNAEGNSVSYQIEFEDQGTYLHARVRGQNTPEVTKAYLRDLNARCAEMGRSGLLIEEDLRGPSLSTLEVYQIASDVEGERRPVARTIAFVDINPQHSWSNLKFAENVAVNRGVNFRVFERVEEAERWLVRGEG